MMQAFKVGRLKDPKERLISLLPKLIESAILHENLEKRFEITIDCGGIPLLLSAPVDQEFTEILRDAFIESNEQVPNFKLVLLESLEPIFLEALNFTDSHGNLLLREFLESEKFVAIDRSWNAIYFLDKTRNIGGVWAPNYSQLSLASFITPLRTLISWCIDSKGLEIIHAAGVEIEGKGLLLTGPSGSGKSTIALYAALQGHGILGDDAVIVNKEQMKALYRNAKIEIKSRQLKIDGKRVKKLTGSGITKHVLPLENNGFNFLHSAVLHAVILPFIGEVGSYRKIGKIEAIKEFMPQTTKELLGGTRHNIANLFELVETLPFYRLELSNNASLNLQILTDISRKI